MSQCDVMEVLGNAMGVSFYNICVYQIKTMYTMLNLQNVVCQLYLKKAGKFKIRRMCKKIGES